jgi:hypothetical protein
MLDGILAPHPTRQPTRRQPAPDQTVSGPAQQREQDHSARNDQPVCHSIHGCIHTKPVEL